LLVPALIGQGLHALGQHPRHSALLAALVLLHAVVGGYIGLSVDEAHYLLYAYHPALSYFDHPPLVGWVQIPWVALDAPVVFLRLVPGLFWLGTVLAVYRLAGYLQGNRNFGHAGDAGLWALGALALAPLLHVLGIGLVPDTLLMFFTVLLMGQTLRLMQPDALAYRADWLLWGCLLGLAGLSKYTAIFMALASGLCLLSAHGLRVLRAPWAWLAVVLALLMVSPVLLWNAQHDWVSFRYQGQHGAGSGWHVANVARFALLQLLAFGPLLLWGLWGYSKQGALRLFFALPWLVLAYLAGGGSSLPHWTAPAWVALAPFAGVALARFAYGHGDRGRQRLRARVLAALVALQGLGCAALLWLMLSAGAPFLPRTWDNTAVGANPFAELYGWDQAGARATSLAQAQGLASVSVQNWTLASRLGWVVRPLPVHVLAPGYSQFSLWAGDLPLGASTLLVDNSLLAFETPLGPHGFADCQLLDTLDARHGGAPVARFRFYACYGWAGDPQPRNREPGP
jgi:4-amino-4-deoxy-L-arabinose transferase-like glycosyltransferase